MQANDFLSSLATKTKEERVHYIQRLDYCIKRLDYYETLYESLKPFGEDVLDRKENTL